MKQSEAVLLRRLAHAVRCLSWSLANTETPGRDIYVRSAQEQLDEIERDIAFTLAEEYR